MEEFKSCLAERVSAYLSEHKTGDIFNVKYQWTNMSLLTRLCLWISLSLRLLMVSMWMDRMEVFKTFNMATPTTTTTAVITITITVLLLLLQLLLNNCYCDYSNYIKERRAMSEYELLI